MNTKIFMLGILLIAGLSFAGPIPIEQEPENWMMYSVDRYGCNYYYNGEGWDGIGLYDVAAEHGGTDYWDLRAMDGYIRSMSWAIWDTGTSGMCADSVCWDFGQDPSPTGFRQRALQYGTASAGYRAAFLSGLRAYLADGGSRESVFESMVDAREDYLYCLSSISRGPCYMCRT